SRTSAECPVLDRRCARGNGRLSCFAGFRRPDEVAKSIHAACRTATILPRTATFTDGAYCAASHRGHQEAAEDLGRAESVRRYIPDATACSASPGADALHGERDLGRVGPAQAGKPRHSQAATP